MMQGSGIGLFAASGVLLFTLGGSPILFWIAIVSIVLAAIFLVFAVLKRRKEAREARPQPALDRKRVT
jgi:hypothetical protein